MTETDAGIAELTFPSGLPGFPELRRFALERWGDGEDSPYSLLLALEQPEVRFLVAPPEVFFPDYEVELSDTDVAALGLTGPDDALVLVIITVPDRPEDATANLVGPIVLNTRTGTGAQVVLADSGHSTRAPLVAG